MNLFLWGLLVGWTLGITAGYRYLARDLKKLTALAIPWPRLAMREIFLDLPAPQRKLQDTVVDAPRQELIDACQYNASGLKRTRP